ncbi:hypothetical protein [Kroppenstedtia sanguinis]|uniref:hypothetical protein n=1 Tax=Kroppenstedtia sanguinis TaxID=1380684 RepID=UPI0036D2E755
MKLGYKRIFAYSLLIIMGMSLFAPFSLVFAEEGYTPAEPYIPNDPYIPNEPNIPSAPHVPSGPDDHQTPEGNHPGGGVGGGGAGGGAGGTPDVGSPQSNTNNPGLWLPLKYTINDIIFGQVKLVKAAMEADFDAEDFKVNKWAGKNVGYNFFGRLMRNGIGLALPSDSGWKSALDVWTGVDNTVDVIDRFKDAHYLKLAKHYKDIGDMKKLTEIADKIPKPMSGMSRFLGVAGIGISGGEGVYNTYKAITADSGQETVDYSMKAVGNVGGALMAAAPFTGPAAGWVAGVGALLWGASTVYANRKQIWKGMKWVGGKIGDEFKRRGERLIKTTKVVGEGIKKTGEGIKKAGKVIGSGMKKVGSWLKSW